MIPSEPTAAPRKSWPRRHKIMTTLGVLLVIIVGSSVGASLGSKTPSAGPGPVPVITGTISSPSAAAPVAASSPPLSASTVTFVVTGWGNPSINYGSDSDSRSGGGTLGQLSDGNATPWSRSMKFDPTAQYYVIDAQLEGQGDISCKIVVTGPNITPLTVASGHASGGSNICSAQAAPQDPQGSSWQKEG